jgi:hypothetical protein
MGPQANLQNLDHPLHILKSGSFGYISGVVAWPLDTLIDQSSMTIGWFRNFLDY